MNTPIPRKTALELTQMTGGALTVRYIECVRRLERQPDARWLYTRTTEAGDELYRRMKLGLLSDVLCGLVGHNFPGPWGSPLPCDCSPSVEEGGWGQHLSERSVDAVSQSHGQAS